MNFRIINADVICSELYLCRDFMVTFTHPKPNCWWRFWQFFLLGWKWKDVTPPNKGVMGEKTDV